MKLQLEGKVAVVTGANNPYGIGAAIARSFAKEGVSLLLTYHRGHGKTNVQPTDEFSHEFYEIQQLKNCEELILELQNIGVRAEAIEVDLAEVDSARRVFSSAERYFPEGIDILVNNAAFCVVDTMKVWDENHVPLDDAGRAPSLFDPELADRHFAVNARSVAGLMHLFALQLVSNRKASGRIINISTGGAFCFPGEVSYGASKSALEAYTRSASIELGPLGITANVLSPGPVQTGWISTEHEEKILSSIPLGRLGTPEDIADAALFLASARAGWITGTVLKVGGGGHRM